MRIGWVGKVVFSVVGPLVLAMGVFEDEYTPVLLTPDCND